MRPGFTKYHSRKITRDGLTFDSAKEYRRYKELQALAAAGVITDLQRQVRYVLIPAQREASTETFTRGPRKGQSKPGRLLEKECAYIADFSYKTRNGAEVVEDTKGMRTKDYVIKRKLMLYLRGIRIMEV